MWISEASDAKHCAYTASIGFYVGMCFGYVFGYVLVLGMFWVCFDCLVMFVCFGYVV